MYWGKSQKSTHKRLPAIKSYWISVRDEMANDFGSDFFLSWTRLWIRILLNNEQLFSSIWIKIVERKRRNISNKRYRRVLFKAVLRNLY